MKQILYGVGKSVLKDFVDPKKIVAFSKLKDVVVSFSGEEEPITGGDSPYPITYFPRDKAIQVTATNALFDIKMLEVTQGTSPVTGVVNMTEFIDVQIPENAVVELDHAPNAGSLILEGFSVVEVAPVAMGEVQLSDTTLTFFADDAGKYAEGIYERASSASAETVSGKTDTFSKPFVFIHRIPVYDDNTNIVAEGQLIVFKAKSDNSFEFNLAPQTAFAPRLVLNALDARRADKKLWDFTLDPVVA